MNPYLTQSHAELRTADLTRAAERDRLVRAARATRPPRRRNPVVTSLMTSVRRAIARRPATVQPCGCADTPLR